MGFQSRLTSIDIKKGCIQQIFVRLGRAVEKLLVYKVKEKG
jgi:hypothetical protein